MRLRLLPVLLALGAAVALEAVAAASPAEVLLAFAEAARGDNAGALGDWRAGTHPCTWTGVGCGRSSDVTALRLPRAGLQGVLHPDLALLPSLQYIDLAGNALGGRLPARWARLASLERLYLDRNRLTGALPATWNMLEDIQYLSLSGNLLNGTLPVAWSSMGLQLYMLDLSGNTLTGALPPAWGRQRMLMRLALARNNLTGPLPRDWGRLRGLMQLDLGRNALTGRLPTEWGALRQASALDLSRNALAGPLPPSWSGLVSMQMLSLAGNQLSGAVPAQWAPLSGRAFRIALGSNPQLCGVVPPALAPAVLASGSSARGSGLGQPCSWEADAAALLQMKLSVMTTTGAASPLQQPGTALADWQEGSNPCSQEAWAGVSCRAGRVAILNLANAGLRLPTLEPLGSLAALQKVLLAGNSAPAASLPASWAALDQLEVADLGGMGLGGSLPDAWAALGNLKQLRLGGNTLNGTLPASWAAMGSLAQLDVSKNSLSGRLPPEWSALVSLNSLDASSNYLSSGLPDSWYQMDSLQEMRLASNNLGGAIPASWAHLPSLTLLDLGSNVGVCGTQPPWRGGTQVGTDATSMGQSCIMVGTSGAMAGAVLGVALSVTLASLTAVAALAVYVRRQRVQLALLQRERSSASFTSFMGAGASGDSFAGKLASLHTFSGLGGGGGAGGAAGGQLKHKTAGERATALMIPNPWDHSQDGEYIQVPMATPGGHLPGSRTPKSMGVPDEHRSPSPTSGIPSPERHLWQVAAQAADRGLDLTARRARQKRLFRSRSEAHGTLVAAALELQQQQQVEGQQVGRESSLEGELEMLRTHSRVALLPPDGGMV